MSVHDVTRLRREHAREYRALMLCAYALHPDAFTSTVAERASLPMDWWETRLSSSPAASSVVFGAFTHGVLTGVAGVSFGTREKTGHKATLFGMYVASENRGTGIARALLDAAVGEARARGAVSVVQLTVTKGNDVAEQLYMRAGFQRFRDEPFAIKVGSSYLHKLHMWCEL